MTGFVLTALGLAFVAAFAVLTAGLLAIRGRAPALVAVLVLGAANIVGGAIALSAVNGVTRAGLLAWHAVLALLAGLAWLRRGRPRVPRLINRVRPLELGSMGIVCAGIAVVVLAVQLYLIAVVAPSNWDSMAYHLSRAAYWLQYQSVGHYSGATLRQTGSAPNAEILVAWVMLLPGSDRWVEITQWLSLAGIMAAVFSGARLLGFAAGAGMFAATVLLLLPQPLLQSTTTQNDLVVAFFVAAAVLFLVRGVRDHHLGDLTIAGLALGLAVGTKTTALFALPALGLAALASWRAWRPPRGLLVRGAAVMVAGTVALGSFNYVLNTIDTGDPFGQLSRSVSEVARAEPARNLVRTMWAFADTGGVGVSWLDPIVQRGAKNLVGSTAGWDYPFAVDVSVNEDTSGFGLVGFLVLPLLLLWALLAPRSTRAERVLALGAILYLVAFGLRIDDNPWVARLMITAVVLAAPLFARLTRVPVVAGAVLGLALVSALPSLLTNPAKPLSQPIGARNVADWSRLEQMTFYRRDVAPVFAALDRALPADAPLAVVANEDSWDYPVFGPRRERRVTRIAAPASAVAAIAEYDVAGVLYLDVGAPPPGGTRVQLGPNGYLVLPPA